MDWEWSIGMLGKEDFSHLEACWGVAGDKSTSEAHSFVTIEMDIQGLTTKLFLKNFMNFRYSYTSSKNLYLLDVFHC